jgi:hypothetical protein
MLTARCLRNFSTDTGHPHGIRCDFLSMAGLMNERRERYFQHLRLSKAFEFPTRRTMSIACRMARCRRIGCWAQGHEDQLVFNFQTARKLDFTVFTNTARVGRRNDRRRSALKSPAYRGRLEVIGTRSERRDRPIWTSATSEQAVLEPFQPFKSIRLN